MSRLVALAILALALAAPASASAALGGTMGITGGGQLLVPFGGTPVPLGDVDGDGYGDMALYDVSLGETSPAPGARAVFGQAAHANLDLDAPSPRILPLEPLAAGATIVGPAGDVNGDGTDDVLLTFVQDSALQAVIFGGPGIRTIQPDQLASRGFAIVGGGVSPVGDVNGDGRDDLLGSSLDADGGPSGPALLVWGKTTRTAVDLRRPGAAATAIGDVPDAPGVPLGADVNGDGIDDLVMPRSFDTVAVVFGAQAWTPVSFSDPGARGYVITNVFGPVLRAGDVTGDRREDLIVPTTALSANIVPGQSGTGTLRNGNPPADPGDSILLNRVAGGFVSGVAPVGDVTGDGRDDLAVTDGAATRLVSGRSAPATVDLASQPKIPGLPTGYTSLIPVGDVDGDGHPDVLADSQRSLDGGKALATLIMQGTDVFAPQFLSIDGFLPSGGASLTPSRFRVGAGATTIRVSVSEEALVEVVVRRASGADVGTVRIPVPSTIAQGTWDGRVNGRALPTGDYRSTVTPIDAAGNRGPSRTVAFTILP